MPTVNLGNIIGPPGPKGDTGPYHFEVNEAGELILYSAGDTAPNYRIDENGHLLIEDQTEVDLGNVVGGPGKSAYEFAQDGGYVGTETDFIEKLSREYLPVAGGTMTGPIDMNDHVINGLSTPVEPDEAVRKDYVDNAASLGLVALRSAAPVNILDNSDFRNPINQRGQTEYKGSGYCIDRWQCNSMACHLTLEDGYISMKKNADSSSTATQFIKQTLEHPELYRGKTLTLVVRAKGTRFRIWVDGIDESAPEYQSFDDWTTLIRTVTASNDVTVIEPTLQAENGGNWQFQWAALYEGEYTTETLPEYHPKGYAQELLECQRYYRRYSYETSATIVLNGFISSGTTSIICPPPNTLPMRIGAPTVSFNGIMIIRGINGYETQSDSSGYSQPTVDIYGSNTKSCPSIRIRKQDLSAWGLTNNTVVSVVLAKDSILELNADL